MTSLVPVAELRARFAAALSDMYRTEVPQYDALIELVRTVNRETLEADPALAAALQTSGELARIDGERHGAIRLGTADELSTIARAFRLMGMRPVGYYDLAAAGVPVHSTAFRPTGAAELTASPFRVFTSLLRIDLLDRTVGDEAIAILGSRHIVSEEALLLMAGAEAAHGLDEKEADRFVMALLETFRWHQRATIEAQVYARLLESHRLVADIVSFPGPHINHLTPRTLDIDAAHARMATLGFGPKDHIEGPPRRDCPILLRQTSFRALAEPVSFPDGTGRHTARFGEIEQRGAALTPKGRARYDRATETGDASALPDDVTELRRQRLAFFRYSVADPRITSRTGPDLEPLIADGTVVATPITYEDFLPVSAAGIFQSNLGEGTPSTYAVEGTREAFEQMLGARVLDEFRLYARDQAASLSATERALGWPEGTAGRHATP